MKNKTIVKITSLIAAAVILVFAAVSCAPPELEISDYDWTAVNEQNDPARNGGENPDTVANLTPTVGLQDYTYGKDAQGNDNTTIVELEAYIIFPENADVLRGEITKASLSFISFHSFTKATTELSADTLGSVIPFEVERRAGKIVYVKLTTSINTTNDYSDIVMKIDGKGYTLNHGIRVDVDTNGKFEDVYDDLYATVSLLGLSGAGAGTRATNFEKPGQQANLGYTINLTPNINSVTTATTNPSAGVFEFVGTATTTTSNTLSIVYVGYSTNSDPAIATAQNNYRKDVGGKLAEGIKLQKLNGESWTDVKTAEYDGTATSDTKGYIVFKNITFDHLATYRIVWQGSAYTETTGTYYGVKQRLYIENGYIPYNPGPPASGDKPAVRYTRTEVVGGALIGFGAIEDKEITVVNGNVANYIGESDTFGAKYTIDSYDIENKKNVLKIELSANNMSGNQLFWNSVSLDTFKKSFQVVYSLSGTSDTDLIYIDVQNISFKEEFDTKPTPSGDNVLYITLDPNIQINSQLQQKLYFRINNDITITDKKTPTPYKLTFGDASPLYEHYVFYQASTWNGSGTLPPPAAPTGVQATATSSTSISITWNSASDADYWFIYRDGSPIDMTYTNSYSDTGLSANTQYEYSVVAVNNNGISPNSTTVSATTQAPPPAPTGAPANLYVYESADNEISLTWDAVSGATYYELSSDATNWADVGNNTFFNGATAPANSYTIYVRAVNSGGSGPSSTFNITILTGSTWISTDDVIAFTRTGFTYTPDSGTSDTGTYSVDGSGVIEFTSAGSLNGETAIVDFTTGKLTLDTATTEFDLIP